MLFTEFNLNDDLLEALDSMGFVEPTPIQEQAIPIILEGNDLIACAQTGTGKTAAFVLPVLHKIAEDSQKDTINTLVLAPTRELALQIDQQVEAFSYFLGTSSLPVYGGGGGASWDQQKKALTRGADMIIATPGRLIAHLNMGYANFKHIKHLILDEADRMLDMGFYDDIMKIIKYLPKERQNLLFSATMPSKIRKLASTILHEPKQISLAISKPAEGVTQRAYLAYERQKIRLIEHILSGDEDFSSVIIFASTKRIVKELTGALIRKRFKAKAISSDLEQKERESALQDFKAKRLHILVATDILARGIDIKGINLIINYDVPQDAEDYVHRIGRTARADAKGVAITLISDQPKDQRRFQNIENLIEQEIEKLLPPEELGEAPQYNPSKRGGGGRGHSGGRGGNRNNRNRNNNNRRGGKRSGGNRSGSNRSENRRSDSSSSQRKRNNPGNKNRGNNGNNANKNT